MAVVSLVTVVAFESLAISTVMPIVEADLGEIQLYGWVFSAFYMGTLIGVVVGGNAVDHVRPIGPMMVGIAVFMAGLVAGGLAPSMEVLVAGRFLQGLGAGVVPAVSYVVVARGFPDQLHPQVFAAMSTAWIMPALVSPLLASVVARHVGWRWVFLGLIPVTAVVAAIGGPAVAKVDDTPRLSPSPGPAQSSPSSAPSQSSSSSALSSAPVRSSPLLRVFVLATGATAAIIGLGLDDLVLGLPLAAVGLVVMIPAFTRLTPPGTLAARPRLPATILIRGLLTFSFFSADAFLSLAVTSIRHRTTIYAGFALVASSVFWTVGSWVQARYLSRIADRIADRVANRIAEPGADRIAEPIAEPGAGGSTAAARQSDPNAEAERAGSSRLVGSGGLLLLIGACGMIASLSQRVPIGAWVLSSATMGLGMGLAYTTISVVALAEAEPGREGAATSALQMSDILGVALGTGLAGVMVAVGARFEGAGATALACVFGSSAVVAFLVAALAPRLSRVTPTTAQAAPSGLG
ncbi:MAG: MFS transporter [Microthrixaceae bacterium]